MTFVGVNKMWLETHDIEIRKQEREKILEILRNQHTIFKFELNEPDNPFSISYRDGKENGIRIAIMEVESHRDES